MTTKKERKYADDVFKAALFFSFVIFIFMILFFFLETYIVVLFLLSTFVFIQIYLIGNWARDT
jgi:hypothetical protein